MHSTVHAPWCDQGHVQWGTPECSLLVTHRGGLGVMLYGDVDHVDVVVIDETSGGSPERLV